jgi:6-phosphofructokinase 1
MKRIGVFTSGGDAPGMNAAIRAVVRAAIYHNLEVSGIERGFDGMIQNRIKNMNSRSVSNIIQRGGTILKTARSQEFLTYEGRRKAFGNLEVNGIQGLVAIGGNGTYAGAKALYEEFGIPVIGIPGTIDNDLYGTDHTIGYDTAINTALDAIDKIRDTADSHDRIFFIEVMGRDSGFIALDAGVSGGAEAILIPETWTDIEMLAKKIGDETGRKKTSQIIVVAEGDDAGGVYEVVEKLKQLIPHFEYRVTVLGHVQRGGAPTARDRVLASRLGVGAVTGLMDGRRNVAAGIINDKIEFINFEDAINKRKPVSEDLVRLAEILSI